MSGKNEKRLGRGVLSSQSPRFYHSFALQFQSAAALHFLITWNRLRTRDPMTIFGVLVISSISLSTTTRDIWYENTFKAVADHVCSWSRFFTPL